MCNDISFWRQSLVLSSPLKSSVSTGIMIASPSILNPALLDPNGDDIHATVDQTSWIASIIGISALLGLIIYYFLMRKFGRKITYLTSNLCFSVGNIMLVFATNISTLLAARCFQGMDFGSQLLILVIISEYSHPKRRGYFIALRKIFLSVGVLLCHALALCWTWRQVAGLSTIFSLLAFITNLFWPESPSYLAVQGKFAECEASYKWLNGNSQNRKELDALISTQNIKISKNRKTNFKDIIKKMLGKDFRNPLFISVLLILILEYGGRHYMMVYSIKMMVSLIGDKSSAVYIVLCGDCLTILATIMSCVTAKHFKRRTIFFPFGILFTFLMLLFSLALFLKSKYNIVSTVDWLAPTLLVSHGFISNFVYPYIFILFGEIFPLEYRELGTGVVGSAKVLIYFVSLKTMPISLSKLGLSGTFLLNGLIILICFVSLYFVLPETKDKTLLEIECEMRGEEITSDEVKPLSTFRNT